MVHPTLLPSAAGYPPSLLDALGRAAYLVGLAVLFLVAIALSFARSRELYGGGESDGRERRVNCPSCGARTRADSESCEYCDETLDE